MSTVNHWIVWGVRVNEPIVTLTDIVIAALCIVLYYRLGSRSPNEPATRYYRRYFLVMALATALGGILGHAFLYALPFSWKLPGWILSMVATYLLGKATLLTIRDLVSPSLYGTMRYLNSVPFLVFLAITITVLNFTWVAFHTTYGLLLFVLPLEVFRWLNVQARASKFMVAGVVSAILTGAIFAFSIGVHQWFNHLALSHVTMAASLLFFYWGAQGEMRPPFFQTWRARN